MRVENNPGADLTKPLTTCEVLWREGLPCPNPIAEVAVCTNAPGFLPMCEQHAAAFKAAQPHATVRYLTRDAFEAERAAGLYTVPGLPPTLEQEVRDLLSAARTLGYPRGAGYWLEHSRFERLERALPAPESPLPTSSGDAFAGTATDPYEGLALWVSGKAAQIKGSPAEYRDGLCTIIDMLEADIAASRATNPEDPE